MTRHLTYILLAAWSLNACAGETSMHLTIPRTSHPPTLDGKLAAGEWDDATAVTGIINQFDGFAHPRQATFWMKYDDKNVYVAQRSTLLPGEKSDRVIMPPLYFKDNQNTVTICLAPNRINSGDTPSWYRYMANITSTNLNRRENCDQIKGMKFISISSVYDLLDARHIPNTTHSFNSFNADGTVWESEYVIPLTEMNVEKTPDGEEWGVLLARDYPQQDQNAIVQTTSYRFDYTAQDWRNLSVLAAYHLPGDYVRASLSATAPVVQVVGIGEELKCVFFNPAAVATSLSVEVNGKREKVELAASERKEWSAKVAGSLRLAVNDAAGKVLYRQTIPVRAGYGQDRLTYVPDVWFGGEPKLCAGQIVPLQVYNPIHNTLWVKVARGRDELRQDQIRIDVSVRRRGEDKPFVTYPMSEKVQGWGNYELHTTLPELKPGVYEATANVHDKQTGKLLARSRDLFIRYDHKKDLPWIGSQIGVTDKVLSPWTPIESKKTKLGLDLSCWGRTYSVDGSGLFTQVRDLDENILTAPVRVEITQAGKVVPLMPGKRPERVKSAANEAEFQGSLRGDGWKIVTHGQLDYDGYLLYRFRFEPVGTQQVDRIQFIIPLADKEGRYMHAAACPACSMRAMVTTGPLKTDKGEVWNSGEQIAGPTANGCGLKVGNFKPYVWVGGSKRGLAFMADSDEGWVPDDTKKVSAIEIVRTDTGVNLVLNLVARPFAFTHAREITFSLQATPVRPLPDDFRQARLNLNITTAFVGMDPDGWGWDGCRLWLNGTEYLGGNGTQPFPLNWERNADFIHGGFTNKFGVSVTNVVVTKYEAMSAEFAHYEVNDPRVPGLQGANWYGYLTPEITCHRDLWDASVSRTEMEYRLWRYQRWIHETGLHGFYFDNSYSCMNANPDAGLGYVLDLPDRPELNGQIQPGHAWTGIREKLKRLRTIIVQEGYRPYIWLHVTDTYAVSAYAFADFLLDGEDGPQLTPKNPWFSEKWSPGYMQTLNDSSKWGLATTMLELRDGFGPHHLEPLARANFRDNYGYFMLHDCEGTGYHLINWSGFDVNRKADFLPYWDEKIGASLATGKTNVFASAWRQDNKLVVIVFNRSGDTQRKLPLTIDPTALGITGKEFVVKDLDTEKHEPVNLFWAMEDAMSFQNTAGKLTVTVDIAPHDYRLLRIEEVKR